MQSTRQSKVARLIQKDLGEIFQMETRNSFGGKMISVTTVRMSPDLGLARIYLSIFPSKEHQETLKLIQKKSKTLRHLLAQRVRHQLRAVPELSFYIDDSLDYIENINGLLDK